MDNHNAYFSEIFSSIQGEGSWIGFRQIFLRFLGCDLRCTWCDTPGSLTIKKDSLLKVHHSSFTDFHEKLLENPVALEQIVEIILTLNQKNNHHSLSLTGGEPLLQAEFIRELLLEIKPLTSLKFFLETGGHLPQKLEKLIGLLDFVSFDLKIPSSTKEKVLWREHQAFIEILNQEKIVSVAKVIITSETSFEELILGLDLIKNKQNISLVLQPVSNTEDFQDHNRLRPENLDLYQKEAIKVLGAERVRIIPQTHKILGVN